MIHARLEPETRTTALLHCKGQPLAAVIGASGIVRHKQEGDHATPSGLLPLRRVFWRADRIARPATTLPAEPLAPDDGWCDDPASPAYNTHIRLPSQARHEKLWRDDRLYDLIIVLGYNDDPVISGRGSAIFMHLRSPDSRPTEGCIALSEADLRLVLASGITAISVPEPD
ncbi:L,D-transpeptidase family protein [Acetobacter sp. AN02]|uniref:L,D-transpeptidase family protein n=1 Tax=Acetobacter sp. AN02 TaxID=2894186 RepID=UPI00243452F1|nr:L,D-transpeptidase family protein [Acetobacter sp. AN02]MDG6095735.1 L,D-transpeptidase family protein [Acetobacter sp. AN02]